MKPILFQRILRGLVALIGISLGISLAYPTMFILEGMEILHAGNTAWGLIRMILHIAGGVVGLLASVLLSGRIVRALEKRVIRAELWLQTTEPGDFLFGSIGVGIGLAIAFLITRVFSGMISWVEIVVSAAVYLALGYIGGYFGSKRWRELPFRFRHIRAEESGDLGVEGERITASSIKVLDTSALIDGRILDVVRAGFLEGTLAIPAFVLTELRHIADSGEDMRRRRGRRGLDILRDLQRDERTSVLLLEAEENAENVDADELLLRLAMRLSAAVLTTDYNLNKVAQVSGVAVLNINELANAVKPVLLPGEELLVRVVKEGKEFGQGIAYLDDGTMVVIENGRGEIGREVVVSVTSTLQTSAGRMVFARSADDVLEGRRGTGAR